jgi:hypothetical protein
MLRREPKDALLPYRQILILPTVNYDFSSSSTSEKQTFVYVEYFFPDFENCYIKTVL